VIRLKGSYIKNENKEITNTLSRKQNRDYFLFNKIGEKVKPRSFYIIVHTAKHDAGAHTI